MADAGSFVCADPLIYNRETIMREPTVRLSVEWPIATLTLNRPESLNAISLELIADFNAALDEISAASPPSRCVVLTGAGRAFCVGGDITAHRDRPPDTPPYDLGDVLERYFNPLLLRLMTLTAPLVIAVNGAAAGAGCPLALCGDVVVASRTAYFECGFTRIGLIPDLGATWLLPKLVGRARAHAMLMLNQRVEADEAHTWGMILKSVAPEELAVVAREIASRLCSMSTPALRATRAATLEGLSASLRDTLRSEARIQHERGYSDDFFEGIAAFFARRPPRFKDP
jgi:2-(1,2-epoxy-1,2-dihydrophenyl)acetyl-CoA isomerase